MNIVTCICCLVNTLEMQVNPLVSMTYDTPIEGIQNPDVNTFHRLDQSMRSTGRLDLLPRNLVDPKVRKPLLRTKQFQKKNSPSYFVALTVLDKFWHQCWSMVLVVIVTLYLALLFATMNLFAQTFPNRQLPSGMIFKRFERKLRRNWPLRRRRKRTTRSLENEVRVITYMTLRTNKHQPDFNLSYSEGK
ncbi:hypothetical protein TcasGA2_TC008586 [Tribolium castaneum]|uniref:Uncharacterized protein n=1 Tax=Tribolium castaneum TaxID=7070 RepID=D7EID0_TRICA|nr:hypothetical protein TcasGA2_TC008586 [Tribolium castaneum]